MGFFAQGGYTQDEREKLENAMKSRERKYGYRRGSNASLTKPKEYANIAESDFADPVGFNYPVDKAHVRGAVTYWQHMDHRRAYSDPAARAYITEHIVRAALKFGIQVTYDPKDPDYVKLPESLKKQMQGYKEASEGMLGNFRSFQAVVAAQEDGKRMSLQEKLVALQKMKKGFLAEREHLWEEQQIEIRPITAKYNQKRRDLMNQLEKIADEIEMTKRAIGPQLIY